MRRVLIAEDLSLSPQGEEDLQSALSLRHLDLLSDWVSEDGVLPYLRSRRTLQVVTPGSIDFFTKFTLCRDDRSTGSSVTLMTEDSNNVPHVV